MKARTKTPKLSPEQLVFVTDVLAGKTPFKLDDSPGRPTRADKELVRQIVPKAREIKRFSATTLRMLTASRTILKASRNMLPIFAELRCDALDVDPFSKAKALGIKVLEYPDAPSEFTCLIERDIHYSEFILHVRTPKAGAAWEPRAACTLLRHLGHFNFGRHLLVNGLVPDTTHLDAGEAEVSRAIDWSLGLFSSNGLKAPERAEFEPGAVAYITPFR